MEANAANRCWKVRFVSTPRGLKVLPERVMSSSVAFQAAFVLELVTLYLRVEKVQRTLGQFTHR